jgi:PHD/YefM family antitoxin component YafN of YafNO toxin-antitoxin module
MFPATLDISEARKEFSRLDERLREEHLIWITRHNKKAFAVVDIDLMQAILETLEILKDPESFQMLQQSLDDIQAGRLYEHKDVKSELWNGAYRFSGQPRPRTD